MERVAECFAANSVYLPLKGGGRFAQRTGWGLLANAETPTRRASPSTSPFQGEVGACGSGTAYFNAPAVIPVTILFCSSRNSARIGSTNSEANAITRCQSETSAPMKP
jgi:hypothetical protein